jgi:5-formyltetrahydrofolate cyclo-ligase
MDTKSLRQEIRIKRQTLSRKKRQLSSIIICKKIIETAVFQDSRNIALYYSQKGEVDVLLLHKLCPQKKYYLPILNPDGTNSLIFGLYSNDSMLINNKYNIPEPDASKAELVAAKDLDLVIVPLVIFDDQCNRVGMGGGYYDRTFAFKMAATTANRPCLLGVAYEFQKIEEIVANSWDVSMQMVITEENSYSNLPKIS